MKIPIEEQNCTRLIESANVKWFEADGNNTNILLTDGNKIVSTKTLKHYDVMLDEESFFRAHDKYLINLEYVYSHSRGRSIYVTMNCKTTIPVSVRRKSDYLKAIGE